MNSHLNLFAHAAERAPCTPPDVYPRGKRAARLRLAMDYVLRHLDQPGLNAEKVARQLGVSGRAVQMLFEAERTTLSAYVREQRLLRAFRSLRDPRLDLTPISQIAYAAGFVDLSHFNRCFRRRFGDTPSRVRLRAA